MELSSGGYPTHRSVRPNNPVLGGVGLLVVSGIRNRFRHHSLVFWMYAAIKILHFSIDRGRRNSKHGLQVTEPGVSSRLDVPFPSHRLAGFHCQAKAIIESGDLLFREFVLRDVLNGAAETNDLAVRIAK